MTEDAIEGDSSPHAPFDPILDCAEAFKEGIVGSCFPIFT